MRLAKACLFPHVEGLTAAEFFEEIALNALLADGAFGRGVEFANEGDGLDVEIYVLDRGINLRGVWRGAE